jgi:signal transduction histidine kinase/predicted hydrocarbon binding protein
MSENNQTFLTPSTPGELHLGDARMALFDIKSGFWSIRRQMIAMVGEHLTNSALQQSGVNGGASYAKSIGSAKNPAEQERLFKKSLQAFQDAGFGKFEVQEAQWPIGKVVIEAHSAIEAWMTLEHEEHSENAICAYSSGVLVGFINVITGRKDVVCVESACEAKGDAFCQFELLPAEKSKNVPVVSFTSDPGLGHNLNLLEILFERMPMGIAIFDRSYHFLRYNETWEDFAKKYAPANASPLLPGVHYFDVLPGSEEIVIPIFERVLAGETIRQDGLRFESGGIVSYWDIVLAPLIENETVQGILNVTIDATERIEAQQHLERRVADRTSEIQMLLNVSAVANRSLDLDEMLETTLDLVVTLMDASRAGVLLIDESSGELEARLLRPPQVISTEDLDQMMQACGGVIANKKAIFINTDPEKGLKEPGALLPLQIHNKILGVLVIIGKNGGKFNTKQQSLFSSVADQLGVAIEKARLYEKVEQSAISMERNRLARDLHDAVTQTLFSASLIAEVLPKLWENNPDEGRRRLEEVRQLTRGALSEMRTLLLELRPTSFNDTDLVDLVTHLVNAFIARTRLQVKYTKEVNGNPSPFVNEVFFRVAQETFNNIVKHADATQVNVNFKCQPEYVELSIEDNGCGFNPDDIPPDHLGVGIMKERAKEINAELSIFSKQFQGTLVNLIWNGENMEKKYES